MPLCVVVIQELLLAPGEEKRVGKNSLLTLSCCQALAGSQTEAYRKGLHLWGPNTHIWAEKIQAWGELSFQKVQKGKAIPAGAHPGATPWIKCPPMLSPRPWDSLTLLPLWLLKLDSR
jgi:hypothetical protein